MDESPPEVAGDPPAGADGDAATPAAREVVGLARGGLLNLVGSVISQLVLLALTVYLDRTLGRNAAGVYFEAYAFLQLLSLLCLSGFRAGLTRFVAVNLAEGDRAAMRGVIRLGIGITTPASLILGAALWASAGWLSGSAFHEAALAGGLRLVGVSLPALSLSNAALSATQGFRTMKPYALVGLVLEPVLRLSLSVILVASGHHVQGALVALAVSSWVEALAALVWLKVLMGRSNRGPRPTYQLRRLLSFSIVSWMASLASTGLVWADTILLGILKTGSQVGLYTSSTRVVTLATFVATPITASLAPRIADLYHRRQSEALRRVYTASTSWIVRLSVPAFVVLLVFPHQTLRLFFGARFVAGASVTVILSLGSIVDSATGPCGLMLNMSGRITQSMVDNVGALALNIVLNLVLIPRYGIVGSAVAWAIALVVVNAARVLQVRRGMGMLPFDRSSLKGFAAGVVAAGAGVVVLAGIRGTATLFVGTAVVCVVYVAALLVLGVSAEDRLILVNLLRRSAPAATVASPGDDATLRDLNQDPRSISVAIGLLLTGGTGATASPRDPMAK
ncbi:MAG TPA: flippase [Acidimicrobiales bacterium]|jgi:O-antigen/teichoic acid export membrane protein|nr:flippase [Acidimicrobiales bacterium]